MHREGDQQIRLRTTATFSSEMERVQMDFSGLLQRVIDDGSLDRMLRGVHRNWWYVVEFADFRQEVLLRAWEARLNFKGTTDKELLAYLYRVSQHMLITLLRRGKSSVPTRAGDNLALFADDPGFSDRSGVPADEFLTWLAAGLTREEQELLQRKYWANNELRQIASEMGRSYRSVVQMHYRAIRKLRAASARKRS